MTPKTRASTRVLRSSKKRKSPTQNGSGDLDKQHSDGNTNNDQQLGSGLAAFFGDFIPYEKDAHGKPIRFSTGLSDLPTPRIEDVDHIEKNIGIRYVPGGLSYSDWRRKEKDSLIEYLKLRLHPHDDNEDETGSSSESSQEDKETIDETQLGMETQEPLAKSLTPKPKTASVPCIQDCLHDLTKLEFLDLHAKTLSLNLSRIDKVWKLRPTKRFGSSIRKPVFEHSSKRRKKLPQRLVFEEREEDGPVATIYKKVIHLEVEELQNGPILPNHTKRENKRIKVFFYNAYATAISQWLTEQQQQKQQSTTKRKIDDNTVIETTLAPTDIVMSLSNVPAACIFPYALDPRNWRERKDQVDYCLCIGDGSGATLRNVSTEHPNSTNQQIQFDSNRLEIRLMTVMTETIVTKTSTDAGTVITNETSSEVDVSSELILSKSVLAKEFLSSSAEDTTPGIEVETKPLIETTSLQMSWEAYQKNQTTSNFNKQSATATNEAQLPGQTQPSNEKEHKATNSEGGITVEPMIFEGGVPRKLVPEEDYNYVQLGDIAKMVEESIHAGKGSNFKVNVYAAVVAVTPPRITKRGDWMVAATLLDESSPTPMTINIFGNKQTDLPNLVWMGDVVRIHRAAIDKWYEKIQLQGLKPTQYVVIRKIAGNWKVIPTAKHSFTFTKLDEERSQKLWYWANLHLEKHTTMKAEHCFSLEEMLRLKSDDDDRTFEQKDITVMVVQKLRYQSADSLPQGLLRVWDGSGNPPSDPVFMPQKLQALTPEEQLSETYPKAVQSVISASEQLQAFHTMETPISMCGRVSNVIIWEKYHWDLIQQHIPVGTFLRLRNVHIPQRWEGNNFRSIFMYNKSWMTALPTNNYEVRSLLYQHSERLRRGTSYNHEFGGVALACKFVGSGLKDFCTQISKANVYTGAVHLHTTEANGDAGVAAVIVKVADRSGSVSALVPPKIHHRLTTLQPNASTNRRFLVTIRRVVMTGSKQHLVLTNLAPVDPEF